MVNIKSILEDDPTLSEIDRLIEEISKEERPRPYLGMSSIGESCSRKLWYRFRFVDKEIFNADTLKRFEDGHRTETLIIDRLKLSDKLTVIDVVDGKQIGFVEHNGHYKGHLDGKILGILQAPKTWHVLEIKCCSDKKIAELKKAITDVGEKEALRKWNPVYYAQAQEYMRHTKYERHYLIAATPGGRDWISVRTNVDVEFGIRLKQKAKRIIESHEPLDKIGKSDFFECRMCSFKDICHEDKQPLRNCRTCLHSTPIENGEWHCNRYGKKLTLDEQIEGCPAHLFLPSLVGKEIVETTDISITYRLEDGSLWTDSEVK